MSDEKGKQLSNVDVRLLALAEHGHTFRPADAADGVFDVLLDHLRQLRDRGCCLDEGHIMKSQRGAYLMAGPVTSPRRADRRLSETAVPGPVAPL